MWGKTKVIINGEDEGTVVATGFVLSVRRMLIEFNQMEIQSYY